MTKPKSKPLHKPKKPAKEVPDYNDFEVTRTSNIVAMVAERGMLKHKMDADKARLDDLNLEIGALMAMAGQDRLKIPALILGLCNGRSQGKYDRVKAVEEGYEVDVVEGVFKAAYVKGEPYTYVMVWDAKEYDPDKKEE